MRYIKLFAEQFKQSVMSAAIYRVNFWLMLIQSFINSIMGVVCVEFIYGSVDSIAGWDKNEMIVLICTSQIVTQLFDGIVYFNQNNFISSVGNGSFDRTLLRPISIIFQTSTGNVDISSLISTLGPLVILISRVVALEVSINVLQIALFVLFVLNGVLILSSFMLSLYSFVFVFIKVDGLNNIYYSLRDMANKPKELFIRKFIYGFIFIIPVIPLANAPASILLGRSDLPLILICLGGGLLFPLVSYFTIRAGLRRYTSASS